MKKEEVPQDLSSLGRITREICYATDETGKYTTQLSRGWDVKINALDAAWDDIAKRAQLAKEKVLKREASPLLFFMEYRLMDLQILAGYTGFWKWQIKRHLKPDVFEQLPSSKLQKYADTFDITIDDLINMNVHEN
jgi:hypothetical protein